MVSMIFMISAEKMYVEDFGSKMVIITFQHKKTVTKRNGFFVLKCFININQLNFSGLSA